jgi:hypothetical protein
MNSACRQGLAYCSARRHRVDDQSWPIGFHLGPRPELGRRDLRVLRDGDDQDRAAGLDPVPQVTLPGLVRLELERLRVPRLDLLERPGTQGVQGLERILAHTARRSRLELQPRQWLGPSIRRLGDEEPDFPVLSESRDALEQPQADGLDIPRVFPTLRQLEASTPKLA